MVGGSPATAAPALYSSTNSSSVSASSPDSSSKKSVSKKFDAQVAKASQYMRTSSDGSTYFDVDAAKTAGADATILEVGAVVNQLAASQNAGAGDSMAARLSLPIWGNWCGPGHGGGAAVDVLDSICRTHDRCYGSKGYFACSCDRAIVRDIKRNAGRMKIKERTAAAAVSVYFTYCACNPFK